MLFTGAFLAERSAASPMCCWSPDLGLNGRELAHPRPRAECPVLNATPILSSSGCSARGNPQLNNCDDTLCRSAIAVGGGSAKLGKPGSGPPTDDRGCCEAPERSGVYTW